MLIGDGRGEAAIEFAFALPLLLLISFGVIDFARAIQVQTTLNYAVQAAARCYVADRGTAAKIVKGTTFAQATDGNCGTAGVADTTKTLNYASGIATGLTAPTSCFWVNGTAAATNPGGCPSRSTPACSGVLVQATLLFNLFPGAAPIGERSSGIPTSLRLNSNACYPT